MRGIPLTVSERKALRVRSGNAQSMQSVMASRFLAPTLVRALSARSADRPEFQRMIKDAEKELFEIVLVWKLDRFSRDRYDSAYYKHILKKHGIKVVSAKENISEGPEGIILESMLESILEAGAAA